LLVPLNLTSQEELTTLPLFIAVPTTGKPVPKLFQVISVGDEEKNAFSPVVQSNRQTELDVQNAGLDWVIGRNGIYIEPDLEYIDTYVKEGEIRNCAGDGKCSYTSRTELGYAYAKMLIDDHHNGHTYNLVGTPVTQKELAEQINRVFTTQLKYNPISFEDYNKERKEELGEFIGGVIAGIYKGINDGVYDIPSDYEKATGRPHQSFEQMVEAFKNR